MDRLIRPTSVDRVVLVFIGIFAVALLSYIGIGVYALTLNQDMPSQSELFDQRVEACTSNYSGDKLMDCIDAAQLASCQFEPLPPTHEDFDSAVDGRCSLSR